MRFFARETISLCWGIIALREVYEEFCEEYGDKVTADVNKRCIKYYHDEVLGKQLKLP